jgi:hypothetical protein
VHNENLNCRKQGKHRDSLEIIEDCGAAEDLEDDITTPQKSSILLNYDEPITNELPLK